MQISEYMSKIKSQKAKSLLNVIHTFSDYIYGAKIPNILSVIMEIEKTLK